MVSRLNYEFKLCIVKSVFWHDASSSLQAAASYPLHAAAMSLMHAAPSSPCMLLLRLPHAAASALHPVASLLRLLYMLLLFS